MNGRRPPSRVAVLGPGGIGGLLAALLARRGDQLTCLAPAATAAHLAEHGLQLRSPALGDARVAVEATSRLDHPVDVCLVTVKTTQLERAVEAVPPDVLGGGLVVPFLNGIDHVAWLRRRYPPEQVVAGTIRVESTRVGPGLIEHTSPFAVVELATGPADGERRARIDDLAARLGETGLDVMVRDDEAFTLWDAIGGSILRAAQRAGTEVPVTARLVADLPARTTLGRPVTPTRWCRGAWR